MWLNFSTLGMMKPRYVSVLLNRTIILTGKVDRSEVPFAWLSKMTPSGEGLFVVHEFGKSAQIAELAKAIAARADMNLVTLGMSSAWVNEEDMVNPVLDSA